MTKMTQAEAMKRFEELTAERAARLAAVPPPAPTPTLDAVRKLRDSLAGVHAALTALGVAPDRQELFMLADFAAVFQMAGDVG